MSHRYSSLFEGLRACRSVCKLSLGIFLGTFASSALALTYTGADDTYTVNEDSALNVPAVLGVLANDTIVPLPGSVSAVNTIPSTTPGTATATTQVSRAPMVMQTDGSFFYDPRGKFDYLAAGESVIDKDGTYLGVDYTTRYTATSLDGTASGIINVTITIQGVNDVPTNITIDNDTLPENAGNNHVIGTLSTTDVDNSDTHTYSFCGGTDDALFDMHPSNNGKLRAINSLDAENKTSYSICIRTDDGNGGTFDKTLTINVTDENDNAPVVTPGQSFSISESIANNASVGTVVATDADVTATSFQDWTEEGGTGAAIFEIKASTGEITVTDNSSIDYESATSYTYLVSVKDTGGKNTSATQTITINVTDENDTAPVITSASSVGVDENLTAVLTVTSTDADTVGGKTFSISGGADSADFSIDGSTGALTFNSAPDFENPADADTNNVYLVQVRVSDGVNSTDQLVTVTVNNLSDTDPTGTDKVVSINEDATYTFQASDFGFSDPDGDSFASVALTTLPASGTLKVSGVDVAAPGTQVVLADIPNLTYVPVADEEGAGYGNFTFTVRDSSGTDDAVANAFTMNVTAVADAPTVASTTTVNLNEDNTGNLGISASLNDASNETLSVVISGLPSGASITDGTNSSTTASTDVSSWALANITVTPKSHDDTNFTLTVTATAEEAANSNTASTQSTSNIVVTAVADVPGLTVTGAVTGDEDSAIPLTISGTLVDTDGSETLTYQITGVPTGATLNNGSNAGGGVWNLAASDVTGLTITQASNDDANFSLAVTATATETSNSDAQTTAAAAINVTVTPVADSPALSVSNASGSEDTAISLSISGSLNDADGSETLTYQITGVPTGASLNNGADAGGGVWNLAAGDVVGLTLTPATHYSANYTLGVSATATEGGNGDTATTSGSINVTMTAVADQPNLTVTGTANTNEDTAVALTITGSLVDTDGSETLTYQITGVPTGASLNKGADAGGGTWNLGASDVTGLELTPAAHNDSEFSITVSAISTEASNSDTATRSATIDLTVTAVADTPNLTVTGTATGNEDSAISLTISGSLVDTDGSETLTYRVSGVPSGASLSAGTDAGGGVYNLTAGQVTGLTVTPKANDDSDFTLSVTATASDNDSSTATTSAQNIGVTVTAVADVPTISVTTPVGGNEDTDPFALTISGDVTDTDGSETLSYQITGVISQATLSAGTNLGGGVWTLTEAQAESGLTINIDQHVAIDFQIEVSALATEANDGSTQLSTPGAGRININIADVADAPSLTVNSLATGNEDTAIPLTISGSLVDTDGSETLTMYITGHPATSTFSAGSDLGGGQWAVDSGDLAGLTITAAANNNDDFTLTVVATAEETNNGDTQSISDTISVVIQPVNDAPTLGDSTFSIDENTPNGTVVGTITATDVEPVGSETAQTISYSITGTAFAIDSNGQITVADVAQLDYETTTSFVLTATATDSGLPNQNDDGTITINLNSLSDIAPVAVNDAATVDEQDSVTFDVVGNDTDADLPGETLSVYAVNGEVANVGVAVDIETNGKVVGALTVQADGTATFVATSVASVEEFTAQATYTVTDGTNVGSVGTIDITINPINDNAPELSAAGTTLEADGLSYQEDQYTSAGSALTIVLNDYFIDYDIDADGVLDSSTSADLDGLSFSVSVDNPSVVQYDLSGTDLRIFSAANIHGSATITVEATDEADPSANISSKSLSFLVTVESVNDAPIYSIGYYSNITQDEDAGDIVVNLADAFSDADLNDSTPGDDSLTYELTIIDNPNDFVLTPLVDDDPLTVISDTDNGDGDRVLVFETTDPSINIVIEDDAHGTLDITVRAYDQGRPPASPAAAIPLSDSGTFRVTINGIGDDQPAAEDDHYNDFPELVIFEDSDPITFDVTQNDYHGDVPLQVISAGQVITDASGEDRAWRTTSRLADPNDTGDYQVEINGEVSCSHIDCVSGETPDTILTGNGISNFEVIYRPRLNFHGEDSFEYCIQDSFPGDEDPILPSGDPRCATVTVNVLPVNDKPVVDEVVQFTMDQADDLVISLEDGLRNFVRDVDNTHIDGQGCDPYLDTCTSGTSDRLYYYFAGAVTDHGQLFAPFTDDGAFNYRPDATFAGDDSFDFQVCDTPTPGDSDHCATGTAQIVIEPLEGAPEGSSDEAVEFDYQLAQTPLELPIGPEPNVLIVNDDSGSMAWDMMVPGTSDSLFRFSTGHSLTYLSKATAGSSTSVAPSEESAPNQGLWKLRYSGYNSLYYNPEVRYKPWEGLDPDDNEFPDSPPTAARHNPLSGSNTTNLTTAISYTGKGVLDEPYSCTTVCTSTGKGGTCTSYYTYCTGGSSFQNINVTNYYIPRYYTYTDLDNDGVIDDTPSPANEAASCATNRVLGCSEGGLVEIRNDGTQYPRSADRTDCATSDSYCTYSEEIQNFANWFTYYRSREFTAKAALGLVVANAENIRVGYAKLNSTYNTRQIESMNTSERTGAKADLLDAIYATNSSGGTPLRRALRDAGRHYQCAQYDIFDSSSSSNPGDAGCPILPQPDGNCQQNFTLLITDGTWNGSSPGSTIGDADDDNNTNFDGGAFAGSVDQTLADVAMYYYERDLHSGLLNEVPTTSRDRALADSDAFENGEDEIMHQHMTTYTVGFGVSGIVEAEPSDYTQGFTWGDPSSSGERKIDDLRHAAYNGRGKYLDASNAANLGKELVQAFEEFSQGSGAASAVSFNSQEIQEDTLIFRAFYNTKINTGDLIAQTFTDDGLGEEPVWSAAEQLDLKDPANRQILTYDPSANQGIPFRPASLNTDQRNVFISDPSATEAQKNTEVTQRVNYLRGESDNERPVGNFRERPAIEGRLGDIVHSTPVFVGAPDREGRDAVPFPQSNLYSSYRSTYADRRELIVVSANDGMMHGVDASDGEEVFAFVPNNLLLGTFSRNITELLNYEYTHKFFIDLTPAVNDVYMDTDGDGDKEWATIVIGGQGAGAKAYFALNLSDPTKLTETTASDVVLWEFTEADDSYPTDSSGNPLLTSTNTQRQDLQDTPQPVKDLGYTFSVPTIAMSNLKDSDGEHEWVAMFGNGFNSTAGIAKLFVLFLDGGVDGTWCHPDMIHNTTLNGPLPADCVGKQDFVKIDTGFGVQDGYPNGLGTPRGIDIDGNGTLDYAYAGDTFGNFFRFDLTSDDFDDWTFTKIFEAAYEDDVGNVTAQPITTQPIVTEHPTESDGYIVIFATGSYITIPDGSSTEVQSIYGLWDRLSPELLDIDDMVQQRFVNAYDSDFGYVRLLTNNEVDYSVEGGKKGWYNHLDSVAPGDTQGSDDIEFPGERAVRNIQLRGGLTFVNSIIPRSDTSCVDIAGGFALSFCPGTGGTNCLGNRGIFDLDNDGDFDEGDEVDGQVVAGLRFEDAVPTDSSFIEDKRITQLSDKSLDTTSTNTSGGENTGRLSWKQLDTLE